MNQMRNHGQLNHTNLSQNTLTNHTHNQITLQSMHYIPMSIPNINLTNIHHHIILIIVLHVHVHHPHIVHHLGDTITNIHHVAHAHVHVPIDTPHHDDVVIHNDHTNVHQHITAVDYANDNNARNITYMVSHLKPIAMVNTNTAHVHVYVHVHVHVHVHALDHLNHVHIHPTDQPQDHQANQQYVIAVASEDTGQNTAQAKTQQHRNGERIQNALSWQCKQNHLNPMTHLMLVKSQ